MAPKRNRKLKVNEDDYEGGPGGYEDDYVQEKPKMKQKKVAAPKGKKVVARGAKLQFFKTMPLDILSEICRHCDPLTLLQTTQTASAFRTLLHSSSRKTLWKSARASIELPEITAPDFTDWAYTSLVLERNCHIWGKSKAVTVNYALRARACANCMRADSKQASKMYARNLHRAAFECCPSSIWNGYEFWWTPTAWKIIVIRAKKDALKMETWEYGASRRNEDEVRELKRSRRCKIEAKMIELGWAEDDNCGWSSHKSVDQPRDLTDRIWNTIRPDLISFLEEQKAEKEARRLASELQARQLRRKPLLRPFYESLLASLSLDSRSSFSPFANFTLLPHVLPFWSADDVETTPETLSAASDAILTDAKSWSQHFKIVTFIKLAKAHGEASPDKTYSTAELKALSQLATSSFSCGRASCKFSATYPSVVNHIHEVHVDWNKEKRAVHEEYPFTSRERIEAIGVVVVAAGLDPLPATVEQPNALGDIVSCQPCPEDSTPVVGKGPMNWSEIVAHSLAGHDLGPYHSRKCSPPRVVMAGQKEEETPQVVPDVVEKPVEDDA